MLVGQCTYGLSTDIEFHDNILFTHNSANTGGGIYFVHVSLKIKYGMRLNTSFNNTSRYGGAIFYEDTLSQYQCSKVSSTGGCGGEASPPNPPTSPPKSFDNKYNI